MRFNTLVDGATLVAKLDDPEWVVFDCRFYLLEPDKGRGEYVQEHIPGARYADLDRDLSSPKQDDTGRHPLPDAGEFIEWLRHNGLNNEDQVVVYDANGGTFAARLWWMLRWVGHGNVAVLDGGWPAWTSAGNPVDSDLPATVAGNFNGEPDDSMWVTTAQVETRINNGRARDKIVDARAEPRFNGEHEPIDPVAGHIPGAVNRPCSRNVDDNGFFLSPAQLRQDLAPIFKDREAAEVINMCGSGVTACRNILAMEIAGWAGTRLYVGSWSEWITNAQRPIQPV